MDFIFVNVIQYLDKGKFEHKKQPLWEKLIIFISSVLIPKLIFTFLKPKFSLKKKKNEQIIATT